MASEGAVEGVETTKIELELAGASATLAHVRDEFASNEEEKLVQVSSLHCADTGESGP